MCSRPFVFARALGLQLGGAEHPVEVLGDPHRLAVVAHVVDVVVGLRWIPDLTEAAEPVLVVHHDLLARPGALVLDVDEDERTGGAEVVQALEEDAVADAVFRAGWAAT